MLDKIFGITLHWKTALENNKLYKINQATMLFKEKRWTKALTLYVNNIGLTKQWRHENGKWKVDKIKEK